MNYNKHNDYDIIRNNITMLINNRYDDIKDIELEIKELKNTRRLIDEEYFKELKIQNGKC